MPVNQVNWGAVQSNAMSNALNMAKAQEIGRNRQAQNIMTQQAQQGIGYRDSANALAKQGFHDVANDQLNRANAQDKAEFEQQKRNEEQTKKLFKGARNQKQLEYAFAGAQELGGDPQRIEMMKQQLGPYQKGVTEYKLAGMLGEEPKVDWQDVVDETGMYKTKSPFYKGVALPPEMFGERNKTPRWQTTATLGETEQKLGLTKPVETQLQKEVLATNDMLDNLYDFRQRVEGASDLQQTYAGTVGNMLLGVGEKLGIDLPEDQKTFMQDREAMKVYAMRVQNAYRRIVTGSQANKTELKKIESMTINPLSDGKTVTMEKLKIWEDLAEKANVRANLALKNGFKYAGRNKDGELMYIGEDGTVQDVNDIPSIGNVKPHKAMRSDLYGQLKTKYPQLPESQLKNAVKLKMQDMGYNMRNYR